MSVVATFAVGTTELPHDRALSVDGEVRVELEPAVPVGERVMPFFWATGPADRVRSAVAADDRVAAVDPVCETDGETLFRVEWVDDVGGIVAEIRDHEAVVLEATGRDDGWTLRVRFPDSAELSAFYRACVDREVELDLVSTRQPASAERRTDYDLTPEQYRTLATAVEAGYFEVPRRSSLAEIADELGVSDSAVSQRLRRGLSTLLTTTLLPDSPDDPD